MNHQMSIIIKNIFTFKINEISVLVQIQLKAIQRT